MHGENVVKKILFSIPFSSQSPNQQSYMNRRLFLKTSGLAASGLMLGSCISLSRGANDTIHLAAIGCGRMGRADMKNLLAVADQFNAIFIAVCDVDSRRLNEGKLLLERHYSEAGKTHRIRTYSNYKHLLKNRSIDVVSIVTPDHTHAVIAIAAAKAKKDIYLEKPLSYTIREGQELIRAVRRNQCILQTGTQQRSSIYFRKVCELVRNQKIGELKHIEVTVPMDGGIATGGKMPVPGGLNYKGWLGHAPFKPYHGKRVHPQEDFSRPGWMQVADYGHGMITNWGAHMMDIAQWGNDSDLSAPVEVEASATFENRGFFDVHRQFKAHNRYQNGVVLEFRTLGKTEEANPGVKFTGSEGWASCERGGFATHDRELLRWEPGEGDIQLAVSSHHHANFLEAVRKRTDPITNVEVGHRSNSLCLINLIAAKLGRPLRWNPDSEFFENDSEANRFLVDMRI